MASSDKCPTEQTDQLALSAIFCPEMPNFISPEKYPNKDQSSADAHKETELTAEMKNAKQLELQAIKAAEENNLEKAIEFLSSAITIAPLYSSAYNNRAQVYQLLEEPDRAMEDLNKAIECADENTQPAIMAYTQRAMIYRLRGDDFKAWSDMKLAADMGGAFANSMLVEMNPYGALCNRMLKEAIHKMYHPQ